MDTGSSVAMITSHLAQLLRDNQQRSCAWNRGLTWTKMFHFQTCFI